MVNTADQPSYSTIPILNNDIEPIVVSTRRRNKLSRILTATVLFAVASVLIVAVLAQVTRSKPAAHQRNVIMMISDGFGPASETYARQYHMWREQLSPTFMLPLDHIHVGQSRTQSSSSLITDSAAGATAFSCGVKTYNGAIGVDPHKKPCGTVLESAKIHHDMLTGLVVTSRITHATPAAFSAHVAWRNEENKIAEQQIGYNPLGRTVDLMFGGGICEFLPNSTESSCRQDSRDLLAEAKEHFGWTVKLSRDEFDAFNPNDVSLPLMALFAPSHMDYELDRDPITQPSLKDMTEKALITLNAASQKQGKGFFLMVEGSRIDMASHSNDPATHFYDIWEYQQTVNAVLKFVEDHPDTVLISTSDHETGGLTIGRQVTDEYPEYKWEPKVISRVRNSSEVLARAWDAAAQQDQVDYLIDEIISKGLGITDPSDKEIDRLVDWKKTSKDMLALEYMLGDMVSRRAEIGWTTHGHTAVDVNLYASGKGSESLRGSHENTDINKFIVDYLDLDLDRITEELNKRIALSLSQL